MKLPKSYWIQQAALFVFVGILAYIPAATIGELIASQVGCEIAFESRCDSIQIFGTLFGMSSLMLLFVGAILIPGTLAGIVRTYRKGVSFTGTAKLQSQNNLLLIVSFLAWAFIVTLASLLTQIGDIVQ